MDDAKQPPAAADEAAPVGLDQPATEPKPLPKEFGGPAGLEPTRYGDWERKGICVDF